MSCYFLITFHFYRTNLLDDWARQHSHKIFPLQHIYRSNALKLQANKAHVLVELLKIHLALIVLMSDYRKYSVLPHITDKHMRFSPPPANTSGGYTLI